ncbi:MFS transporter [Pseudarthrobacter sp. J64]|uniref:MFS transporter n=1 Tax=Pseudarthrobacter sp. J64 TaxID=3116485 RepID=UPI002E8108B7|nr:MFS transporter [Pseudarthrobacter sp. J64]MEE2568431.1 MFS transporter [Pseudarthrobacter sp. J64]
MTQLAGRSFIPIGLVARLPLAMLTVGALTLVTSATSSYALGGAAAGAVGIGSAIGAPIVGSMADRWGQRPVLLLAAGLNTLAVLALIVGVAFLAGVDGPAGTVPILAAAFASGASCPQVGPLARVRWMVLTADRGAQSPGPGGTNRDLDTALSYESTADELTFVLGPALVGILASLLAPWLPLALAAVLTLAFVPAFALHPTVRQVPRRGPAQKSTRGGTSTRREASGERSRLMAALVLPVTGMALMGAFFGGTQASLASFAAGFAGSELAGLLYSVMGLSSALTALSVAYWPSTFALRFRWPACAAAMAALSLPLLVAADAGSMVLVLLALGLPVGPVMVTIFAIGGRLAPLGRLGTVMTALASGLVAGSAAGAATAGFLAQHQGNSAAFLVPIVAALALAVTGTLCALLLQKYRPGKD